MCYHNDGGSFLVQFGQQIHHFGSVLRVEVTGRFVGQNQFGIRDYGTGDGYTLLLSAGELLGKVFGTVADVHAFQYFLYPLFPFCGLVAEVGQRQFYVLEDIEFVYQVETLEDEAYLALAYTGTVFLVQVGHFLSEQLVAAFGRIVQQSQNVQQGRLSAS